MDIKDIELEINGALAALRLHRDVDLAIDILESVEAKLIDNFVANEKETVACLTSS